MCKLKHYICIINVLTLLFLSLFSVQIVKATENPLLLLDYTEIDEEHFLINMKFKDLPECSVIAIAMTYSSAVAMCGYDFETGEKFDITEGVITKELYDSGKSGIKVYDSMTSADIWGGNLIFNKYNPYAYNNRRILSFSLFSLKNENGLGGETNAFSICFKRLTNEAPNIKIATEYNYENYDKAIPEGVCIVKGSNVIDVEWKYTGDVFDHTPDPIVPPVQDNENPEEDIIIPSGGSSGGGGGGGTTSEPKEEIKEEKTEEFVTDNKSEAPAEEKKSIDFSDVKSDHWAYEYITGLVDKKIVNGYSDSTFRPDNNITRAEIAKISVATKELSPDNSESVFSDSDKKEWYNGYLTTAYKNNIIAGYPDNTFKPENNITREDLCVILYRMFFDGQVDENVELAFADSEDISDYAKNAVKCFSKLGIVNGRAENKFAPKEYAERAEVAKVVYLCIEAVNTQK